MTASAPGPSGITGLSNGAPTWTRSIPAAMPSQRGILKEAVAAHGLRKQDFRTILDGMDMDVAEDIVAPDLATLDLYCERVASAVGRLSIKVFGMEEGPGLRRLPHHLGRALADHQHPARHRRGRRYRAGSICRREYLEEMQLPASRWTPRRSSPSAGDRRRSAAAVAALAHHHYDEAARNSCRTRAWERARRRPRLISVAVLTRRSSKPAEAAGFAPPRRRVSSPRRQLAGAGAAAGTG